MISNWGLFMVPTSSFGARALGAQDANYGRASNADLYRDKFCQAQWNDVNYSPYAVSATGLGGTYDHTGTVNEIKSGDAHVKLMLQAFWSDIGNYEVRYPAGMTVSLFNGHSRTLGASYTTGMPAGIEARVLTVPQTNEGTLSTSELRFSGVPTGKTSTTLGLRPTIIKLGDAYAGIASKAAVASYKPFSVFRTMDMRGINGDLNLYDYPRTVESNGPHIPFFVDLCNQADMDLWLNMSFYMTDAAATAEYTYVAQNLNSSKKLYIEYSNEVWNTGSPEVVQWEASCIEGMQLGFDGSATSAGATYRGPAMFPAAGNFSSLVPKRNFNVGDTVCGNISSRGAVYIQAAQNITANDAAASVPSTSNSYWTLIVNASNGALAGRRYYSYMAAHHYDLAVAAFNAVGADPSRIQLVAAWQASSSIISGSANDVFEFDSNYLKFKVHAVAPYFGGGQGGYTLGNYASGHVGTWNATTKPLYTTNMPACLDAYFDPSVAQAAITATLNVFASRRSDLDTYHTNKGLTPGTIKLACYECGPHNDIIKASGADRWTDTVNAALLASNIQFDPRNASLLQNLYVPGLRQYATGPICWYARFGTLPWDVQLDELDHSNVTLTALYQAGR